MASHTLTFSHPARRVYTAVKHVMQTTDEFRRVECDERGKRLVLIRRVTKVNRRYVKAT